MKKAFTLKEARKILELEKEGKTQQEISTNLKISIGRVQRILCRMKSKKITKKVSTGQISTEEVFYGHLYDKVHPKLKSQVIHYSQKGLKLEAIRKILNLEYNVTVSLKAIRKELNQKETKTQKIVKKDFKDRVEKSFVSHFNIEGVIPKQEIFCKKYNICRKYIKRYYSDYESFISSCIQKYPDIFKDMITEVMFNEDSLKLLKNSIKKHNKFIITSAVTSKKVDMDFLDSINLWCSKNGGKLLVIPCQDPASNNQVSSHYSWGLDSAIPRDSVVFDDIKLNKELTISTIRMSAKQINPITGLDRLGNNYGSFICGSPKLFLKHLPNQKYDDRSTRAIMTTGAITEGKYTTDRYMSKRTAKIAEIDHQEAAIIVEIEDDHTFHFRQIQKCPVSGGFSDLDKKYLPSGKVEKIKAELCQIPDYHVGYTCPIAKSCFKSLINKLDPEYITLEDFFNGTSINHHERNKCISQYKTRSSGSDSLESELLENIKELKDIEKSFKFRKKIVLKYGNHEDFLYRWIDTGEYPKSPINHKIGAKIAIEVLEGKHPIKSAYEVMGYTSDNLIFLDKNDFFKVNGIENGLHGDRGSGGKRSPGLAGIENSIGDCNVGHSHSAAIQRGVWRVGTLTVLYMGYNDIPSNWTNTMLIQHYDGSRQLINCVKGRYESIL